MENFDNDIAEILEVDTVAMDDTLEHFECWDSLTRLSIIAMVETNYKVSLTDKEIFMVGTVGELKKLIENKR